MKAPMVIYRIRFRRWRLASFIDFKYLGYSGEQENGNVKFSVFIFHDLYLLSSGNQMAISGNSFLTAVTHNKIWNFVQNINFNE